MSIVRFDSSVPPPVRYPVPVMVIVFNAQLASSPISSQEEPFHKNSFPVPDLMTTSPVTAVYESPPIVMGLVVEPSEIFVVVVPLYLRTEETADATAAPVTRCVVSPADTVDATPYSAASPRLRAVEICWAVTAPV